MHPVILTIALTILNIALIGLLILACFYTRREKPLTFWFSLALLVTMVLDILAIWVG